MAASATFALKAGVWFRRGRLSMVSPDSQATACPPSGRNSTYRPVQISETSSLRGTQISDRRVAALRIIEAFDVVEHVSLGLVACVIGLARCALGLQRGEEALHRGIVPHVARAAHRTDDTVICHQLLELLTGVLAAAIGVMQQRIELTSSPDGHDQSIGDELCRRRSAH